MPNKATPKQKGNFGEMMSHDNKINNPALKEQGYDMERIGRREPQGFDDTIRQGIDGIYENKAYKAPPPPPKYIIDEAKFGKSRLKKTRDGKQMSDKWVKGRKRLEDQVGHDKALEISEGLENGTVEKVLSRVDEDGNVTTYKLNKKGKVAGAWPPK